MDEGGVVKKVVLSFGMMVCDTLLRPVDRDVLSRDCTMIEKPVQACGGDALNTAIGLSRLGIPAVMAGRGGDDLNGRFILDQCRKLGIDVSHVVTDPVYATASSFALIEENGERHFLSDVSIFDQVDDRDLPEKAIERADMVYIGSACSFSRMNQGGLARLLRRAKAHGRMTVMDAAFNQRSVCNCWMNMFKEVLPYTDVFFPSYEEASAITGCREIPEISSALKPMGLTYFGIKLGSKGCYVTDFSEERYIECPKGIRAVDTTGAGDSFMAGLMAGLVSGLSFFESAGFGCSVASHSVQHMGAAGGILPYEDELYLYNHHKNQK